MAKAKKPVKYYLTKDAAGYAIVEGQVPPKYIAGEYELDLQNVVMMTEDWNKEKKQSMSKMLKRLLSYLEGTSFEKTIMRKKHWCVELVDFGINPYIEEE
jgi:hypothetical protein